MKILVASDSFKDALSAVRVCEAIAAGLQKANPDFSVRQFPLADGGEGTAEILALHLGGQMMEVLILDPLFRQHKGRYLHQPGKGFAFIEMAQAAGLDLLKPGERNPMATTTYGVGEMIRHAVDNGARHILLAIGGSATNDAGIGMAAALGFRFLDQTGNELSPIGRNLIHIRKIKKPDRPIPEDLRVEVLCDVENPLSGPGGAAFVYAPQKGANQDQVSELDEGLRHFGNIIDRETGRQVSVQSGAGAAGGLGAGAVFFLNAELKPGASTILDLSRFDRALAETDLLVTGEGRLDDQTLSGKLIRVLCEKAGNRRIPVVALCGDLGLSREKQEEAGLTAAFSINPGPRDLQQALRETRENLEKTAENIGRILSLSKI